jgi:large subunit ribosomal protein L25
MYGSGGDRVALSVDLHTLKKAVDPSLRWNTWFNLTVKEEGKADVSESVIAIDRQIDPLKREVVHIDFLRVDPAKEIEATVPVEYSGRPIGVKAGGKLKTYRRYVKVSATPNNIPVKVMIDVTHLDGDETMRISDLKVEDFRLKENPKAPLAHVEVAKVSIEGEEAAAKPVAGKPVAGKAVAGKAVADKAAADKPAAAKPAAAKAKK